MSGPIAIRAAGRTDVPVLLKMITELADFERAADHVTGTEQLLEAALFDRASTAEAVLAERRSVPVGFVLYYPTFSTWLCRPGLYVEDLFVSADERGSGVGTRLLRHVARLALERGCARLEWSALDWNTPAIRFYEQLGAAELNDWKGFRLAGTELERFANA